MSNECEHNHGIDYRQTRYALTSMLAAVHRFTCKACKVEARVVDQVENPDNSRGDSPT